MCFLTTSCSKEDNGKQTDEGGSWEELPNGDIPADNVELNLNGVTTTGTISFKALSAETAQIGLKNVIDGYSDVTVDLAMTQQTDGSYKLNGTKEITTKPVTKADNISAAFLKVTVDGTITKDGVVTANIKAEGPGLYIGTYTGTNLVLKYGEDVLTGKTVVFDATDGNNISLLLSSDVIPGGDISTPIFGIQMIDSTFTGTTEVSTANIKYTGVLSNKVLTLTLDVTMKDPGKWANTYSLAKYTTGEIDMGGTPYQSVSTGALYVNWQGFSDYTGAFYAGMFRGIGGMLLPQVLQSIALEVDGNISAQYTSGKNLVFDMKTITDIMSGSVPPADEVNALIPSTGWMSSPKNLAYWYEKDGKFYIKLNIASILTQAMGPKAEALSEIISQVLNGDAATIKELLKALNIDLSTIPDEDINTLLGWVKNGIPMNVKVADGHTYIYLDKEALAVLFKMYPTGEVDDWGDPETTSNLLSIWKILLAAKIIPQDMEQVGAAFAIIGIYYNSSSEFDLGLDLLTE